MRRILVALALIGFFQILSGCGGDGGRENAPVKTETSATQVGNSGDMAAIPAERFDRIVELFNRGVALMEQYKPVDAVGAFEEVVELAPEWTTGRLNLGIALLNAQDDAFNVRAEAELKKVIATEPQNPYAHYALAMLFKHLTRNDEALILLERVLELDPDDPETHYQVAVLVAETDSEAARAHLEKTLEKIPHHESACYRLQNMLRQAGEQERAQELLMRFKALKTARAGLTFGMKYSEMGHYADVIRTFERLPEDAGVHDPPPYADTAEESGLVSASTGSSGWPGYSSGDGGPASYGPGVAVADVDGDGDLDLFLPAHGEDARGALYLGEDGQFSLASGTGIDGDRTSVGAYFGDYDNDGDPDLYLTCDGPNQLFQNQGNARFVDVTVASGVGGKSDISVGAAWADADHDGDLDLYVANFASSALGAVNGAGAPNALWRNNGDGTFIDVAATAGIDGGDTPTMGVVFFDIDGDHDLDLYLINDRRRNQVFLNQRVGQYTEATSWFSQLGDEGSGTGALLADVDGNGWEDLLLIRGPDPPRLFLQIERARYVEDQAFASHARSFGGAIGGLAGDLDIDGDIDLVFLGSGEETTRHRILMNMGGGRFAPSVPFGPAEEEPTTRGALAVDVDEDGSLELLVARAGLRPELWRTPVAAGRHWLQVVPALADEETITHWVDPTSVGLVVELKAGSQLQVGSLSTSAGYLGNPPPRAHFGLGERGKADYVRLFWADAVLQSEMEVAADQAWQIIKVKRKPSSCPLLFSWDGGRFAFVTDFLGVGGVGFFVSPGEYAPPDPTEDIRIPPEAIAQRDGKYLLRVAEPLEEVSYIDELHLLAYDHPSDWELHPDERFTGSPPFPTGRPFAAVGKITPVAARNRGNEDVLDRILNIDRRYADPPVDLRFVGYAQDHWIELDFGDRLRDLDPARPLVLYLYGWVEYTYSHVNYAAYQAGLTMQPPSIEVPDEKGGWRPVVAEAGFPAGLPRMMTLDVSSLPIRAEGRFRIRTNMEVFWDQIFLAEDVMTEAIQVHSLRPLVADLRFLGYPREYSPDGRDPTLYDYHRVDQGAPFKNLTGEFTRFGDVRPLLREVDDRFVVMARGEEIALEFDAGALPALSPRWSRTFVLHVDGYCKDMDLYTAYPQTVDPLPHHGMKNYPPENAAPTRERQDYVSTWNTRRIVGQ